VAPYSSGYSIGSCNWLICTDKQKIGYLATSSLRHSHPKTMEIAAFSHVDSLIITSISSIDQSPEIIVLGNMCEKEFILILLFLSLGL
jgi:integrator complex subunit 9